MLNDDDLFYPRRSELDDISQTRKTINYSPPHYLCLYPHMGEFI
jgi:hypothetical protein